MPPFTPVPSSHGERGPPTGGARTVLLSTLFGLLLPALSGTGSVMAGTVDHRPADVAQATHTGDAAGPVADAIRNRVEAVGLPDRLLLGRDRILAIGSLSTFYERRIYEPAWVTEEGLRPVAHRLVEALEGARRDGLRPGDYHLPEIRNRIQILSRRGAKPDLGRLVEVELLLTDAFLLYGTHLLAGRLDPATLHANWQGEPRERDLAAVLEEGVAAGDPGAALHGLRPPQPGYRRLMEALASLRDLDGEGGWPTVPPGSRLAPGDTSPRVAALRARLAVSPLDSPGPGAAPGPDSLVYVPGLVEAVRAFQRRHGLEPDGIVGSTTLEALNVPVSARIRQVEVNLERWRWLPPEMGERYVLVNAANFELKAVEDGETAFSTRVIVGRPYRQTPVFSDHISYLVFSPFWHVPHSLAVQDQLPLQKKDPDYFRRMGFRIFRGWGADAAEVDPATVDWGTVTPKGFPYRLRQDPGPLNALGGVKFMFPNSYNVYLHDTPAQDLFARQGRSFSSGCIRVENAAELALWLLRDDPSWTPRRVAESTKAGEEQTVRLQRQVPVHLLYWTAFADADGTVHFRPDIYGRDDPLAQGLDLSPPDTDPPPEPPFSPVNRERR